MVTTLETEEGIMTILLILGIILFVLWLLV